MGSPAILRFKKKKPLFPIASHTKTGSLFGQHFDGELPQDLNHVLLRQFLNCCNKKISTFTVKSQIFVRYLISYFRTFEKSAKFNTGRKFIFVSRPSNFNVILF